MKVGQKRMTNKDREKEREKWVRFGPRMWPVKRGYLRRLAMNKGSSCSWGKFSHR
jgi:hypothetical protein